MKEKDWNMMNELFGNDYKQSSTITDSNHLHITEQHRNIKIKETKYVKK